MRHFCALFLCLVALGNLYGQFGTPDLTDGVIDATDYAGFSYVKSGTTYFIAWNDDSLYVAVSGAANFANNALNIYIDHDNAIPVNSGNGTDQGIQFDGVEVKLPFNADYFGFAKVGFNTGRQSATGSWQLLIPPNDVSYNVVNGPDWIEIAIPWNTITNGNGRPQFFNFLAFLTNNNFANEKLRSIPFPNTDTPGTNPDDFFYFHISNTNISANESPFSKVCFTQHVGNLDYGYNTVGTIDDPALPDILYDITASRGSGETGEARLFMDDDIEIQHDLVIGANSRLQPGGNQVHTITMTGTDPNFGSIYNFGILETVPELMNTTGEKLRFVFNGNTLLRSNGGLGASQTKFSDITVNAGATVNADAAGLLDAELQFGTLINNGTFDMGSGLTGFVNWTLRGVTNNVYTLNTSGNPTNFHRLIIGSGATLENAGTTPLSVTLREDFEIGGSFVHDNGSGGTINLRFESIPGEDQVIKTFDSNPIDPVQFAGLDIASGGDVRFEHVGTSPPVFEMTDALTLTSGRLFTIDESVAPAIRYELVIKEGAILNIPGVTSGYASPPTQPCFVDGAISVEIIGDDDIVFPVGKNQDYRPISVNFSQDGPQTNTLIAEHIAESAAALIYLLPSLPELVLNVSEIRYWALEYLTPTSVDNAEISLFYGDADDTDGVTSEGGLRVLYADGTLDEIDWISISSSGGSGGSITSDLLFTMPYGANKKHLIALGNILNGQNPLPVTWLSFSGRAEAAVNQLQWSTASEQNNDYFEVQRSKDGGPFQPIGQVQGQGTTTQQTDYDFTDDDAAPGTMYYRLQQFDFDGASEFSETIAISRKGGVRAYPNPFDSELHIGWESAERGEQEATLTLWDALGRKLEQYALTDSETIDTSHLSRGTYFAVLQVGAEEPHVFKLIK